MEISRKRLSAIFVGIALIAITGITALSQTWVTASVVMRLVESGSSAKLAIYWDCDATPPVVTDIDWGPVTSGQQYVRSIFVINEGTVLLHICYMPTYFNDTQYKFKIECWIHMIGTKCQLNKPPTPIPLLEKKDILGNPTLGYPLYPGQMIKIDIKLFIEVIEQGETYTFPFEIHGFAP